MVNGNDINALRAIGSILVKRYMFYPAFSLMLILSIACGIIITLTVSQSAWWVLLFFALALWLAIFMLLSAATYITTMRLQPRKLTRDETKSISRFVDTFTIKYAAVKGAKKSPFILAFIIVWRSRNGNIKKSAKTTLTEPIRDIKTINDEFQKISRLFTDQAK